MPLETVTLLIISLYTYEVFQWVHWCTDLTQKMQQMATTQKLVSHKSY